MTMSNQLFDACEQRTREIFQDAIAPKPIPLEHGHQFVVVPVTLQRDPLLKWPNDEIAQHIDAIRQGSYARNKPTVQLERPRKHSFTNVDDYLRQCRKISAEEANRLVDEGKGIVSSGGLNFSDGEGHGQYSAYGVFPGNLRGGSRREFGRRIEGAIYHLNLRDVVCVYGFYPEPFMLWTAIKLQAQLQDYSVDFTAMIAHAINHPEATKELLTDPRKSAAFWHEYFTSL